MLGAAVLGVLVEAALPRRLRYRVQAVLAGRRPGRRRGRHRLRRDAASGSSTASPAGSSPRARWPSTGRPWSAGRWCWSSRSSACCSSPSGHLEGGVLSFAGQAAALPGTEAEREASTRGLEHTEVFPLMLFAVAGMMLFPASNDLLIMFVALEVLSLPLYLLCGLARRRRLLSQEAAMKYFILGAFSSGFFVYGLALVYGYAGSMGFAEIANAVAGRTSGNWLLLTGMGLMAVGPAVQGRRRAVPVLDPGRLPGRADRGHRLHGRRHEGRGLRGPAAAVLRRLRRRALGLAAAVLGRRHPDHAGRLGGGADPDRRQAPAGLLLDRARRLHARRLPRRPLARRHRQRRDLARCRPCCSTW